MLFSLIIVNWNTQEDLEKCLKSIYETTPEDLSFEVLVFDNASLDGSVSMVHDYFPEVLVIKNPDNSGLAHGWNVSAKRAQGDYLVFLNPDIQLTKGCLGVLVSFMEKHPRVAVVTPKLVGAQGEVRNYGYLTKLPSVSQLFLFHTFLRGWADKYAFLRARFLGDVDSGITQEVEQPAGAFIMMRRFVWDALGGADESFFLYYEDVDLAKRVKELGWGHWYVSEASAVHRGAGTTASLDTAENRLLFFTSACRYFDKHFGFLKGLLVMLIAQVHFLWAWWVNKRLPKAFRTYLDHAFHLLRHWRYKFRSDREHCYRVWQFQNKNLTSRKLK